MNTDLFHDKLINQLPFGYAYHKIIFDDNDIPVDFQYIEVNQVFENITGKKANDIIGKKATDVFPWIKKENFDWISFFGNIVSGQNSREIEKKIAHLNNWFRVKAFPTGKDCFAVYISEITKDIEERNVSLESFPVPVFMIYNNYQNISFNKAFEKFIELPADQITIELISELGKKSGTDLLKSNEWSFKTNKGEERHAIVHKTGIKDNNEKSERILGVIIDITQHRINERIIEEQKRISKDLKEFSMDLASIPITKNIFRFICHSIQSNNKATSVSITTFHEVTEEFEYQYSTLNKDADKNELREFNRIFKGARFKLTKQLQEIIKKGKIIKTEELLPGISITQKDELQKDLLKAIFGNNWISAIGLYFEGKLIGSIILSFDKKTHKPANEELEAIAGVCSNAVRRWTTETSLLEEEMHYRRLISSMQQGLALHEVIFDENDNVVNYKFLKVNEAFEKITGLKRDNIIGKTVRDVIESVDEELIQKHGQVALTGTPINYEYYSEKLDKFYEAISYRPGPNMFAIILTDITERKRSEELREKVAIAQRSAEFKQKFLANMSHEIRTPLTGIMGMAEILAKTKLDPEQYDYLNTIRFSTENLRKIIDQILDYSKIEAGKTHIRTRVFETNELLNNAKRLFQSICKKDIKLFVKKDPSLPDYLEADNQRIFQIINNLLYNAVKFTRKGSITINVLPEKWINENKLKVKIEVIDTGIGIKPESQNLLFKPFSQLYTGGLRKYEGTGLGLSICKELVHMLGGDIDVESEPKQGSKFWFTFKANVAKKPAIKEKAVNNTNSKPKTELKILHVEDKVVNQKVVSLLLKAMDCAVITATNGKEALEIVEKDNFDLILMDIQMPVMDGITATKEMKKRFSTLPPIIGLSANAFEGDRERYMKLGMDDYITKPVKEEDFLKILDKFNLR